MNLNSFIIVNINCHENVYKIILLTQNIINITNNSENNSKIVKKTV